MKFSMLTKLLPLRISRKNKLLAIITVTGLATTGTLMATAPEHDASAVEAKTWPVTTMQLNTQALSPELRLFGRIETPHHAQLTAAVTATVNSISVSEGEMVHAGQILMALDDADEELRLLQRCADADEVAAALATIRSEFTVDEQVLKHMNELHELTLAKRKRLEKLQQQNLVATEQLENTRALVARQAIELAQQQLRVDNYPQRLAMAKAKLERAQALRDEQELRLSRTLVIAPFRGRISSVVAAPGDRVQEGEVLISIYDTSALQVRVTLPSNSVDPIRDAIESGTGVQARLENGIYLPLQQLAAQVRRGRSGVDALFSIGDNYRGLELGKAVDITVEMPALENVAAIPVQSLYGADRVYAVVDGRLQGMQIRSLGQRQSADGSVQLLIQPAEQLRSAEILTTSLPRASTGLRVNVING